MGHAAATLVLAALGEATTRADRAASVARGAEACAAGPVWPGSVPPFYTAVPWSAYDSCSCQMDASHCLLAREHLTAIVIPIVSKRT